MRTGNKWKYEITVGGFTYGNDEIADNVSISVSAGSSGFSLGQCSSATISGSLLYKGESLVSENSKLILRCFVNDVLQFTFEWFVKTFTVEDKTIIHFSACDVMSFVDNDYADELPTDSSNDILAHFKAAEKALTNICGKKVEIWLPAYPQWTIEQTGWTIRNLLEYSAIYGFCNYTALSSDGKLCIKFVDETDIAFFSTDNYTKLTVGITAPVIQQICVRTSNNNDPQLQEGETLEDYGIFYIVDEIIPQSNVLNLICPFAKADIQVHPELIDMIGKSYGTQFSCENVKTNTIYPPYTTIKFGEFSDDKYKFYLSNASYKLTKTGIFASMSGDTKSLSSMEYIGKTESELKTKVVLQTGYKNGFISQENGIYWDDSEIQEVVNSG